MTPYKYISIQFIPHTYTHSYVYVDVDVDVQCVCNINIILNEQYAHVSIPLPHFKRVTLKLLKRKNTHTNVHYQQIKWMAFAI